MSQKNHTALPSGRLIRAIAASLWAAAICPCAAGSPTIGPISPSSGASVGRYQKFEAQFSVKTTAKNLQLPYEPATPPYIANLKPDEDARRGVSVDGLFLPPGQSDWSKALNQPGFYYRDYSRTALLPNSYHKIENLVATGSDSWKVRFAPTALGPWQYRIRVTDASGTAETSPLSFRCMQSASKGYVRVSPTDSRYFQFDDGTPVDLVGCNLFFDGFEQFQTSIDQISATGASALLRIWIAGRSGQEIIGGFANSSGGREWFFGPGTELIGTQAHSGRFCVSIPSGSELTTKEIPLEPNVRYNLSAWVKPSGASMLTIVTEDSDGYANHRESTITLHGADWTHFSVPIEAHDPRGGANYFGTVKFLPKNGKILVDDVQVVNDSTGVDMLEVGDFERHVEYSQRQSWLLDHVVDYAAEHGQYLRLVCLENDDSVFCNIGADGLASPHDHNNFFGVSTDPAADIPVRWFQRYYVRYLIARWGYSTAVAQWEYDNEGAPFNGNHYAAAQNFAAEIHSYRAEGHRPASTSFYQNSAGTSYAEDFFNNPKYPDIDYADVHYYPSPGVSGSSYLPYGAPSGGFTEVSSGGPNGCGVLHLDGRTTIGMPQHTPLAVSHIRGHGMWTISYQVRADKEAKLNWFGRGPDLEFWCDSLHIKALTVPNNPGSAPLPSPNSSSWQAYSATFTVPDNALHTVSLAAYASGLTGGSVDFSDIRLIAPDGRLWAHYTFCEPLMDSDTASLAQYLPLAYTSLSGDPSIGKPLSIGETDMVAPDGSYNTQIQQDNVGVYMRQFCWAHLNPSGAIDFLYTNSGGEATERGFWKYAAAYQRFVKGIPLTNGRYRNIEAAVSDQNFIVIGQKDVLAGRAHFFVYNRGGNWRNLATNPGAVKAVSGTVTVAGLPAGAYHAQMWDTSLGAIRKTIPLTCRNGRLIVPIDTLASDMAVKILPPAAQAH